MAFTQKMTIAAAIVAGVDSLQMQVNKQKITTEEDVAFTKGWEQMMPFESDHSRRAQRPTAEEIEESAFNNGWGQMNQFKDNHSRRPQKPTAEDDVAFASGWDQMVPFENNHSRRVQFNDNNSRNIRIADSKTPLTDAEVRAAFASGWKDVNQFKDNHSRRANRGAQQIENEDPFAFLPTVPAVGDQSAKQIVDSIPASEENDQKVKTLVEDILDQNPMIDSKVEQQVLEYNVLDDNHQALVELLNYFKTHNSNKFTSTLQIIQQWM